MLQRRNESLVDGNTRLCALRILFKGFRKSNCRPQQDADADEAPRCYRVIREELSTRVTEIWKLAAALMVSWRCWRFQVPSGSIPLSILWQHHVLLWLLSTNTLSSSPAIRILHSSLGCSFILIAIITILWPNASISSSTQSHYQIRTLASGGSLPVISFCSCVLQSWQR